MTYWTYFRVLCGLPLAVSAFLLAADYYTEIYQIKAFSALLAWLYILVYSPVLLFLWFLFKTTPEAAVLKNIWYFPAPYLVVLSIIIFAYMPPIDVVYTLTVTAMVFYVYIAIGVGVYSLTKKQNV